MQRTRPVSLFLAIGSFFIGTAVFADEIGLSLGAGWGRTRLALLVLGLFIGLLPWLPWKRSETSYFSTSHFELLSFPVLLIVLVIYLWFIGISHESSSNYYNMQAAAFRQGQLSLPLRPDPALLALPNPYDVAARQGLKVPLDLSLYKGKYYLYWGAAPALLLAIVKPLLPGQVSDAFLLFAFVYGTFLIEFLFIRHLRERFFPELPRWIVLLSLLVAGLINPTLWLLNRPKIYETAIAGGQFFFLAGLFSAVSAVDRPTPSGWRLALAGLFWSLAVGTRAVLLLPVAFMALMVAVWFQGLYSRSPLKSIRGLIPLGAALLIGAIAFAWYNWARFGSISETGFSYALTGVDSQKHLHEMFLPGYAFQNLYNYLSNPFAVRGSFPYLFPLRGRLEGVVSWPVLPGFYFAQAVTGLLWAAPFALFALVPTAWLATKVFRKKPAGAPGLDLQAASFQWIVTSLLGSFVLAFGFLLVFFWAAMRYAQDFMPALTLVSLLGFWQAYCAFSQDAQKRRAAAAAATALAVASIGISTLLALSEYFTNGLI